MPPKKTVVKRIRFTEDEARFIDRIALEFTGGDDGEAVRWIIHYAILLTEILGLSLDSLKDRVAKALNGETILNSR